MKKIYFATALALLCSSCKMVHNQYANRHPAETVQKRTDDKILVISGKAHAKDLKKKTSKHSPLTVRNHEHRNIQLKAAYLE